MLTNSVHNVQICSQETESTQCKLKENANQLCCSLFQQTAYVPHLQVVRTTVSSTAHFKAAAMGKPLREEAWPTEKHVFKVSLFIWN